MASSLNPSAMGLVKAQQACAELLKPLRAVGLRRFSFSLLPDSSSIQTSKSRPYAYWTCRRGGNRKPVLGVLPAPQDSPLEWLLPRREQLAKG